MNTSYTDTPRFGFGTPLTTTVKWLLFFNGILFLLQQFDSQLFINLFSLIPDKIVSSFQIWRLLTYAGLHGSFWHLFFNMFALWMFGCEVERQLGQKAFLLFYGMTAVGAGLFHLLIFLNSTTPVIGASGAVYGVLTAFAVMFPHRTITLLLFFVLPVQMKARTLALLFVGIAMFMGIQSTLFGNTDGVAHLAHLGGAFTGFILLRGGSIIADLQNRLHLMQEKRRNEKERLYKNMLNEKRREIDDILDRINEIGYDNISELDRKKLKQASEILAKEEKD